MNHQTRRDQAYKRNMQEWLDLYVRLERETQAFYATHAHIQSEADFTPETKAAFDADNTALCSAHGPAYAQGMRELGSDMHERIRTEARDLIALQDAPKEDATVSEQFHPTMAAVVSWDDDDPLRADRSFYAREGEHDHPEDCTCQQCADTRDLDLDHAITWMRANNEHGHWSAEIGRLERRLKHALAGVALLAALLLPAHASAHEDATQGFLTPPSGYTLYRAFEDHSSLAYNASTGEWIAFDPDGPAYGWHMTSHLPTTAR